MAERRMFAKTIIDSDAFLDMPMSARLLYYDLGMRADDDGFVNSPKKIMKMIGASSDDLNVLILRKFIIPFEPGVVVVKHWRIHNYIRKDTYRETQYKEQKSMLEFDENNAYRLVDTSRQLSVDESLTQDRIGKNRLELVKDSIEIGKGKDSIETEIEIITPAKQDNIPYAEIIEYLNSRIGSNYKATTDKTRTQIKARFNEGFKLDDFKTVIDKKTNEWFGTDMQKYLRPETLFGTKFEGYLNQRIVERKISFTDVGNMVDWEDMYDN